jgi:hypothetical protein
VGVCVSQKKKKKGHDIRRVRTDQTSVHVPEANPNTVICLAQFIAPLNLCSTCVCVDNTSVLQLAVGPMCKWHIYGSSDS